MKFTDIPALSLERAGYEYRFRRWADDPEGEPGALAIEGARNLGAPEVALTYRDKHRGHGSRLAAARYLARKPFIPVLLEHDTAEEFDAERGRLWDMLKLDPGDPRQERDPLYLVVRSALGVRRLHVVYAGGMPGDYVSGEHGDGWQSLGLELESPDAFWSGEADPIIRQVAPRLKPFLSDDPGFEFFPAYVYPSVIADTIAVDIQGDVPTRPVITVTGPGKNITLTHSSGARFAWAGDITEPVTIDMLRGDIYTPTRRDGQLWSTVADGSEMFTLDKGTSSLGVAVTAASEATEVRIEYVPQWTRGI